ncbi:MAG: STAS domain-containing protein [Candidatus Solibacter sp.]
MKTEIQTDVTLAEGERGLVAQMQCDISIRNAAEVHRILLGAWKERPERGELLVDLEQARHIDSSGIGALMELVRDGIPLSLCNLQDSPRRLLERTGLSTLFRIYPVCAAVPVN